MADVNSRIEYRVDKVDCPVCGDNVTVYATYRENDLGDKSLVDFECNMQAECAIPSWDPCPLFLNYMEKGSVM